MLLELLPLELLVRPLIIISAVVAAVLKVIRRAFRITFRPILIACCLLIESALTA
jgi:hypothetical protein